MVIGSSTQILGNTTGCDDMKGIKELESLMDVKCNMVSAATYLNDAIHSLEQATFPLTYFDAELRRKVWDMRDELKMIVNDIIERQRKLRAEFTDVEVQEEEE